MCAFHYYIIISAVHTNVPTTVNLHQLTALSFEHCANLMVNQYLDQLLNFAWDLNEIQGIDLKVVYWYLAGRRSLILVVLPIFMERPRILSKLKFMCVTTSIRYRKSAFVLESFENQHWRWKLYELTSSTLHSRPPWKLSMFKFKSSKLVWLFKASMNWPISVDGSVISAIEIGLIIIYVFKTESHTIIKANLKFWFWIASNNRNSVQIRFLDNNMHGR